MEPKPASMIIPAMVPPTLVSKKEMILEKQLSPPPMGPTPCVAPGANSQGSDTQDGSHLSSAPATATAKRPAPAKRWDQQMGDDIVTLFPRRKAGQNRPGGGRGPVVLTLELLEQFYGMPLHVAAKRLGICQTAIKKVCRRLGIKKWPYKEMRQPSGKDDNACSTPGSPDEGSFVLSIDGVQQDDPKAFAGVLTGAAAELGKEAAAAAAKPGGDDVDFAVRALLDLGGFAGVVAA